MSFNSIGDMAQQFRLARQNSLLKSDLGRVSAELSSGEVADKTKRMNGDTARLSGIEHSILVLQTYQQAAQETAQTLNSVQQTLTAVDGRRDALSQDLLLISRDSPTYQTDEAAREAKATFSDMVNLLNKRVADRALFGGAAIDRAPLAPAEDMLADIVAAIGPATDKGAILAVVTAWFDDPAGGFATLGYVGDTAALTKRSIGETTKVTLDARADDPAIREVLKAGAIAALTAELGAIDQSTKAELLFEGGVRLQSASSALSQLQSRVGFAEAEVERVSVQHTAHQTSLQSSRNDLVLADPFETASRLQALQIQLETHYAMTSRLSRLSLIEYL